MSETSQIELPHAAKNTEGLREFGRFVANRQRRPSIPTTSPQVKTQELESPVRVQYRIPFSMRDLACHTKSPRSGLN